MIVCVCVWGGGGGGGVSVVTKHEGECEQYVQSRGR